jgi:hypothetical protein
MAGRLNSIDLGPMSLPFSEQSELSDMKLDIASHSDIEKLNALLRDGSNNKQSLDQSDEFQILFENNFDMFSSNIDNNKKIIEITNIAYDVFISFNNFIDQTNINFVELNIRENILPDSTIKAEKKDNKFNFELCISCEDHRNWLVQKLPLLVREIGDRIRHPLVISIFDPDKRMSPIATISWPVVDEF